MLAKVYTATLRGLDAQIIEVEVDIARGERKISIVGLPDKAVQESRDRMVSAFRNSGIELGTGHKIINLAPADLPKTGPNFDLPMSIGLLIGKKILPKQNLNKKLFLGELALSGKLRSINGVLPIVDSIRDKGFQEIYVPDSNATEAAIIKGLKVYGVPSLTALLEHLRGNKPLAPYSTLKISKRHETHPFDMKYIKGQVQAKRALEIAAAGGHNLLFSGVPGSGKTLLAKTMPSILPSMSLKESIEVTRIYSISGLVTTSAPLIRKRPFRAPHHTASQTSIIGGGSIPKPGEVSLAHRGVLFLDEFPEFQQRTLEVLRQPIENQNVCIARASGTVLFPAQFQLIAAMNPCKCGNWGNPEKACTCTEYERKKYIHKISGPILDRIDLKVNLPKVKYMELTSSKISESSNTVRARVETAKNLQNNRFQAEEIHSNTEMTNQQIKKHIHISKKSATLLQKAIEKFDLSSRGYFRTLKVARTIADLENSADVKYKHIAEALSFRLSNI